MQDVAVFKASLKPNTKMVWIETPSNPLMRIVDIKLISEIAKKHNPQMLVVVDNTFLTPVFQVVAWCFLLIIAIVLCGCYGDDSFKQSDCLGNKLGFLISWETSMEMALSRRGISMSHRYSSLAVIGWNYLCKYACVCHESSELIGRYWQILLRVCFCLSTVGVRAICQR